VTLVRRQRRTEPSSRQSDEVIADHLSSSDSCSDNEPSDPEWNPSEDESEPSEEILDQTKT
jgi:hypothetical protein